MNLILKILASITITWLSLLILEKASKFGLDHNSDLKSSFVQAHNVSPDVLLHGDCHAEQNLDPSTLKSYSGLSFYNLGSTNSNFADNYLFLYHYLKHHSKPKAILLHVFPGSFDSSFFNKFNTFRFVHLLDDKIIYQTVKEFDPGFATASALPFLKYSYYNGFVFYKAIKGYLDYFHLTHGTFRHADGYLPPMHEWEQTLGMFKREKIHFRWSLLNEKYLVKIIELAKSENIKLIFFELPYYQGAQKYMLNYEERIRQIQGFSAQYKIPYYRLRSVSLQADSTNYSAPYSVTIKGTEPMNELFGNFICDSLSPVLLNK